MNRRERRQAYKSMGILKKIAGLAPLSTERGEFRRKNREQGEAKHRAMLDEIDKERYERLEHAAANYEKVLKKEGYTQEEIDMLLEAHALDSIKNKETYREDKKRSKELKRKVKESRAARGL